MSDADEICRICNEPRSAHVETARGPFTHPKEASGEGKYVLAGSGSYNSSPLGDVDFWERWEFVPSRSPLNHHPRGDGLGTREPGRATKGTP